MANWKNFGYGGGLLLSLIVCMITTGCVAGVAASSGPSRSAVLNAAEEDPAKRISVRELDRNVVAMLAARRASSSFSDVFGPGSASGAVVQPGDVIEVSVWEAPPATLFGSGASAASLALQLTGGQEVSANATFPALPVGLAGTVVIPFAGTVRVAGRSLQQIEADITGRLQRKAHLPQVVVRIARNASAYATVVGEVTRSLRVPLTPKGERVLDVLADAGGATQPVDKVTLQVSRDGKTVSMPLSVLVRDPRNNVILKNGDIVAAVYQPYSFTVLGAAGRNEEIKFEGVGLTLSQALGRIGGLQNTRSDPKGVFIFRWELDEFDHNGRSEDAIPVIYRVNLREPRTYFLAQQFEIEDRDIIYVADAPIAEFQQFVNIIASSVLPVIAIKNSIN